MVIDSYLRAKDASFIPLKGEKGKPEFYENGKNTGKKTSRCLLLY